MKAFDQKIKHKIESLAEVPGVKFNEKKVWSKVNNHLRKNWFPGPSLLIVLLISFTLLFQQKRTKLNGYKQINNQILPTLIETTVNQQTENILILKDTLEIYNIPPDIKEKQPDVPIKKLKSLSNEMSSDHSLITVHSIVTATNEKSSFPPLPAKSMVKTKEKEAFVETRKESQSVGFTYLKPINKQLSLSYGIHFNKQRYWTFYTNELGYQPKEHFLLEIPVGLRYNFLKKNAKLNPFVYLGLRNTYLVQNNFNTVQFNLGVEADLSIDYRIFSGKYGQKTYLRFKVPLYRKNFMHRSIYQPNLYDALNH